MRNVTIASGLCVLTLAYSSASAQTCTTSSDGLTRTCSGDIQGHEFFNHVNETSPKAYTFRFENLTSTDATSSADNVFEMISTGATAVHGSDPGIAGSALTFSFNEDNSAPQFGIHAFNHTAVVLQSTGGSGSTPSENKGSGNRTGHTGGKGGNGGAVDTTIIHPILNSPELTFLVESTGGHGGNGGAAHSSDDDVHGGVAGNGGTGGAISINLEAAKIINSAGNGEAIVQFRSEGGHAGTGGQGTCESPPTCRGGPGGVGGEGGNTTLKVTDGLTIETDNAAGLFLNSVGGNGGDGGYNKADLTAAHGGTAGAGSNGRTVQLQSTDDSDITIETQGIGIRLDSLGGVGGTGGRGASGVDAYGGAGGKGGAGGVVSIDLQNNLLDLTTSSDGASGIFARSYGNSGGDGGDGSSDFAKGKGGSAAGTGPGESVTVDVKGSITTGGDESNAIMAQSLGGFSGTGGEGSGIVAYGGGSESAGAGGDVKVIWNGPEGSQLRTDSEYSDGVMVQSVGGGGGKGGKGSGIDVVGSVGSAGGAGGKVTVETLGDSIITSGYQSRGIFAQSSGGGGGAGGAAHGVVSLGGSGSRGGAGDTVDVNNAAEISTNSNEADGIYAQSHGGGGGAASSTSGIVSIGGTGGTGATSDTVTVHNKGNVTTKGDKADAIFAQSHGGGGGKGSNVLSLGPGFTMAIGGSGGTGGHGGDVWVDGSSDGQAALNTSGDTARGIVAQSLGGGGGHAGNTFSASANVSPSVTIDLGGSGGAAGDGGTVQTFFDGSIATQGDHAIGYMAQSGGGGGGSAGSTIAISESPVASAAITVGGKGSGGGTGGDVTLCFGTAGGDFCNTGDFAQANSISTAGDAAHGIYAASTGGSGGHSGVTISGNPASMQSIGVSVGGDGGAGGAGDEVNVYSNGKITTTGDNSVGLLATSHGGSGGSAYLSGSITGLSGTSASASIGGAGGKDKGSGGVTVVAGNSISTSGAHADAISAVSNAGSGGTGGIALNGTGGTGGDFSLAVGGKGGTGGTAGDVSVTFFGSKINTTGSQSAAISSVSTGGSGGRGGMAIDGTGVAAGSVNVGVGGGGAAGGTAGDASIITNMTASEITTHGDNAPGLSAHSGGGNGGRGGASITVVGLSQGSGDVSVGGSGGGGGTAGNANIKNYATVVTTGASSDAIHAVSIGGNGGTGGYALEAGMSASPTADVPAGNMTITVGGTGGDGGKAEMTSVENYGSITTKNFSSNGILAQSTGGDGGRGGAVYSGNANVGASSTFDITIDLGGSGGDAAKGGDVVVDNNGSIQTLYDQSAGILAQSVGGNGGLGGNSYNLLANLGSNSDVSGTFTTTIGGAGGTGALGKTVTVTNTSSINTVGSDSSGVYAQSIGGTGGVGGNGGNLYVNAFQKTSTDTNTTVAATIQVGGLGGTGANADVSKIINAGGGDVETKGLSSHGLFAQSAGGSGGNGGSASNYNVSISGSCVYVTAGGTYNCPQSNGKNNTTAYSFTANIGGKAGSAGDGEQASVDNEATVKTSGDAAHAAFAQSIGGGGGQGGSGAPGFSAFTGPTTQTTFEKVEADIGGLTRLTAFTQWSLGIGGKGGSGGDGKQAIVTNSGTLETSGVSSHGVMAQTVGGGGGNGGSAGAGKIYGIGVGGSGNSAGNGGEAEVVNDAGSNITTTGRGAFGILAQSVGGGGGFTGTKGAIPELNASMNIEIGGKEGSSGNGGDVNVLRSSDEVTDTSIITQGQAAIGIFAQSIGGGGGLAHDGIDGSTGTVTVGGSGDTSGNAGTVMVDYAGSIITGLNLKASDAGASHGIVAQSVGGGGGYGGAFLSGSSDNFGTNTAFGTSTETTGNGDAVSVTVAGGITTSGNSSIGIFAQSVGGGGGVSGAADSASLAAKDAVKIGSGDGSGSGGAVTVVLEAGGDGITTNGAGAHGIFAQSASGGQSAGNAQVTVTAGSDIHVSGAGAHGIFAQTANSSAAGLVSVEVQAGATVTGGTTGNVSGGEDGAGVLIANSSSGNKLTNAGTIRSIDGASGTAVEFKGSSNAFLTLNNTGTIVGKLVGNVVDNVSGAVTTHVLNHADGRIHLGDQSTFHAMTNNGDIEIGDAGMLGRADFMGNVVNKSGSHVGIDLGKGDDGMLAGDLFSSSVGSIGFETGSKISLRLLDSFQFARGSSFDLLAGVDLWFDGEDEDDFSFFDYVVGDFLNEDWTLTLEDKALPSDIMAGLAPDPVSLFAAPTQSFEVLTATYSGQTLAVPLPGTLLLYLSCISLGLGVLSRGKATRRDRA